MLDRSLRRSRPIVALAALLLGTVGAGAERPNVLLVLVDDLKPAFGAYGVDWAHTPNLDRLASRGLVFDRAYCNQAVCAPSRNHLLVGSRSTSIGVYSLGYHFRRAVPDAVTLPQHFEDHGYHAAGIGKVFHVGHGNVNDERSWSVPFHPDKVVDYVLPESTADGQLTREEALFGNRSAAGLPRGAAWEIADVDDGAYADGRIATEGIRRLRAYRESGQPFFLALGFTKPHLPFCAPRKYWDLYDPSRLPLAEFTDPPAGAPPYAGKGLIEIDQYEPVPVRPPFGEDLARKLIHGYYAAMSYMDAQLGRVLDELDGLGLAENTIVVLWGDHGYHLGDHGAWTKHTNYEEANRIPLIVAAPGVTTPGSRTRALVETVDVYPTLCELAGLPAPTGPQPIDGASLAPILRDPSLWIRDHAYHCFPRGRRLGRAVRTQRYRLVEWKEWGSSEAPDIELYDYAADPLETRNVARDTPIVLGEMRAILRRHGEAMEPHDDRRSRQDFPSHDTPKVAGRSVRIVADVAGRALRGVVVAHGGSEQGYALHFIDGVAVFDVRVDGVLTRLKGTAPTAVATRVVAEWTADELRLAVGDGESARVKSPGLLRVEPKDPLTVGFDGQSAAGDYEPPNEFRGQLRALRVTTP